MKVNNMQSLHDRLFAQLDRLSNAEGEALDVEIKRTDAVVDVAKCIIENGNLVLKAAIAQSEQIACDNPLPKMLGTSNE
ncbi:MAG: hypothetical protein IKB96_08100 [Prevotella sp.]|nr:hypothetical protein [Prevotella sp.]